MQYGLLGERLGHSFSKEIHEKLGYGAYGLVEMPRDQLESFLAERQFRGINVTIPYKQTVIPYLDGLSDRAKAIGAVNTIVNRDGKLYGDNTDFGGLEALLRRMEWKPEGKTVLVAGTGGASKTACAVAKSMGAAEVLCLSRSGRDGALTYEQGYATHAGAEFLIHTTPAGMYPDVDGVAVDLSRLPKLKGVADVVYNPLTTRLVREARALGIPAETGLYMLVAQAVLAAEAFTGEKAFGQAWVDRIYRELLFEKRNIVLTGMPGSGKTTLGQLLSERLGRDLVNTDEKIVEKMGMPITELFRTKGEPFFRDLETEALREASLTGGKIIATGGGAVLRKENVDALKMNGTIVFLDRPLETLLPSAERPLADNPEKIKKLFRERYPIYASTADVTLSVRGTPEQSVDALLEMLQ